MTITVLVADDHNVVAQGLQWMLASSPEIEVLGVATSAEEALARATSESVDVVLMDLNFGSGMSGIEAIRLTKAAAPETRVIVLTMYKDASTIADAIRAGADGYMSKVAARDELIHAIQEVADGRSFLQPGLTQRLFSRIAGKQGSVLSEAETSVLQRLADGQSTKALARDLNISPETVKMHLRHIFRKLGVLDRTGAVAQGLRRGLIR
jgi:DNA-binding NarL/FixJ family response regulator